MATKRTSGDRLQAPEDNLRRLFDTIGDLLIVSDADGRIIHANRAAVERLGYTLDELRGLHIEALHPPAGREEARGILAAMLRGDRDSCPLELETRDGQVFPVDTRIWLGQWDGKPCLFGITKDLSQEREALQKFTTLFENNPALMAISTVRDGRFTEVNAAFLDRLGYSWDEVIGRTDAEIALFVRPDDRRRLGAQLAASGRVKDVLLEVRRRDGRTLTGLLSGELIDVKGQEHLLTVMVDLTEQAALARKVEGQKQRLENIIASTRLGTWEWNVQTGQTVFNERWAEILGYTLAELQPLGIRTWFDLVHPEDLERSNALLREHFEGRTDYYACEARMRHRSGAWVWVLDRGRVIERTEDGQPLLMFGTHADITETKDLEQRIREISIRDPLTNIYNRRYLFERLEAFVSEYRRQQHLFALAIIDIDHFKRVNDRHGHQAGDLVLRELSRMLRLNLRPYDLIGRYGGEEFLAVFVNAGREQAAGRVERMLDSLRHHSFSFGDTKIAVTFSAGIADCTEPAPEALTIDRVVALADTRLYQAKQAGRDRVEWGRGGQGLN